MCFYQPSVLGYWQCAGQFFHNKLFAAIHSKHTGQPYTFHFNDEVLSQINWTVEPAGDISELYRRRAQQLRDKYDHIVIFYSGGADSSTILKTFLLNNIHVDEIVSWGAWANGIDKQSHILNSEVMIAGAPVIKKAISQGTKFTHFNYMDIFDRVFNSTEWVARSDWRMTPEAEFRRYIFFDRPVMQDLVEKGKRVALLFGRDKPRVVFDRNAFWYTTLDLTMGQDLYPEVFGGEFAGPYPEWFYSNIEVPEIMVKQAHMILRHYLQTYGLAATQSKLSLNTFDKNYYDQINPVIYPLWTNQVFTVGKGPALPEPWYHKGNFFYDTLKDTPQYQTWLHGVKDVYGELTGSPDKFSHPGGTWSKFHLLRDLSLRP